MLTDITGTIRDGMWNYGDPFPTFAKTPIASPDWVPYAVAADVFNGLHSQTGTYFETPGHFPSAGNVYNVDDIPFDQLIDMPAHVLHLPPKHPSRERPVITEADVTTAIERHGTPIPHDAAVLIDAGWDVHWDEPFYLDQSPYFTFDAFMAVLKLRPRLLATDFPRWENLDDMQGFFPAFYKQDIWMLAPVVNLGVIKGAGSLSVLPLNVSGSCCVPCRAFIRH